MAIAYKYIYICIDIGIGIDIGMDTFTWVITKIMLRSILGIWCYSYARNRAMTLATILGHPVGSLQ